MADQTSDKSTENTLSVPKTPTGVSGIDAVLGGGLPSSRMTIVNGGPGTGKTVLGMEFLYKGALAGEPGLLIAFEEHPEALRRNARALGWDVEALEEKGMLRLIEARLSPEIVVSGEFDLNALLAIISGQAKALGARRIVIDAIDVLLNIYEDPRQERNQLNKLLEWLEQHELTAIMTLKTMNGSHGSTYAFLDYMADCVIRLDQRVNGQVSTRRLRVLKYRGSGFARNEHPYVIGRDGLWLVPISTTRLQHGQLGDWISSGSEEFDRILGGGYRRGSSVLISGPSGSGKTTLTCTFVRAAAERGEKTLYVNFEESEQAMLAAMLSPGLDLRPAIEADRLRVISLMPEAAGAEEHLAGAMRTVEEYEPDHVVVDALSSCRRMGTTQGAFAYMIRLTNWCKERDITVLMTNQTGEHVEELTSLAVSSVVDAIVVLQYLDLGDRLERMLLVVKSRGAKHSRQYYRFAIGDAGVELKDAGELLRRRMVPLHRRTGEEGAL